MIGNQTKLWHQIKSKRWKKHGQIALWKRTDSGWLQRTIIRLCSWSKSADIEPFSRITFIFSPRFFPSVNECGLNEWLENRIAWLFTMNRTVCKPVCIHWQNMLSLFTRNLLCWPINLAIVLCKFLGTPLVLSHIFVESSTAYQEHYGTRTFYVHRTQFQYSWSEAYRFCMEQGQQVAEVPLPPTFLQHLIQLYPLSSDVWVTDENLVCKTLKEECSQVKY